MKSSALHEILAAAGITVKILYRYEFLSSCDFIVSGMRVRKGGQEKADRHFVAPKQPKIKIRSTVHTHDSLSNKTYLTQLEGKLGDQE